LDRVLVVLWNCLSDMKDDLSSSVGAVMDLLGENTGTRFERLADTGIASGKLVTYEKLLISSLMNLCRKR